MAAATSLIEEIGITAGLVWSYLSEHETVTLSKLARDIDAPRDVVMQGVGWLAREGKVQFQQTSRGRQVSLT